MLRSPLQLMWDLTIHPPSRPIVLADTRSSLQLMLDLTLPTEDELVTTVDPEWAMESIVKSQLVLSW